MKNKNWLVAAILLAGLAVVLGAFGAHGLKTLISPAQVEIFKTGVQYQFYHALAMIISVILQGVYPQMDTRRSLILFALGILCFSGSLYLFTYCEVMALSVPPFAGLITPCGGLFFIMAWLSLIVSILRIKN